MPIFVVWLRPQRGNGVYGLRQFLKAALRLYGLRCISAAEHSASHDEHSELHDGLRSCRRARRSLYFGNQEEIQMDQAHLEKLKQYAAATRSPMAFGGCTFIKWDYKSGKYLVGKDSVDITGKKLVADVPNAMDGFQRLEKGTKPIYALTKILDSTVDPIQRAELGDNDSSRWLDADRDPWTACTVLPLFDEDSRQVFILIAAFGGRSETSNVIGAFVDHAAQHPKAGDQLPVVQLCVRKYTRNDGDLGHAMQLDIEGWADRPPAILSVQPPPLNITTKIDKAVRVEKDNGSEKTEKAASKVKSDKSTDSQADAKLARKISVPGHDDMDSEIPF
jgi:hypothetical protein